MRAIEIIQQTRHLIRDLREAKRDGDIDESEAIGLVQDVFSLLSGIIGEVELTQSVKSLALSMICELLRRLRPVTEETLLDFAQKAYDAYGSVNDHKNYQGLPMPLWKDLTPKIQAAWIAAATKVQDVARSAV